MMESEPTTLTRCLRSTDRSDATRIGSAAALSQILEWRHVPRLRLFEAVDGSLDAVGIFLPIGYRVSGLMQWKLLAHLCRRSDLRLQAVQVQVPIRAERMQRIGKHPIALPTHFLKLPIKLLNGNCEAGFIERNRDLSGGRDNRGIKPGG